MFYVKFSNLLCFMFLILLAVLYTIGKSFKNQNHVKFSNLLFQFPLCDGAHNAHNARTGDNLGPLVVKKSE